MLNSPVQLEQIIRVPVEVCESGYAKICGIDSSPPHPGRTNNWDYWLREWNPQEKRTTSVSFFVTEQELQEWSENERLS